MLRDEERFLALGAIGVVFGVLDRLGRVDAPRSREIVDRARVRDAVFHRALDFVADWRSAMDVLIEMGCTHVLSSGGQASAASNTAALFNMNGYAAGRMDDLPGGGIQSESVMEIVSSTGCGQVHIGAARPTDDGSLPSDGRFDLIDRRFLGGASYRAVDGAKVAATVAVIRNAAFSG